LPPHIFSDDAATTINGSTKDCYQAAHCKKSLVASQAAELALCKCARASLVFVEELRDLWKHHVAEPGVVIFQHASLGCRFLDARAWHANKNLPSHQQRPTL